MDKAANVVEVSAENFQVEVAEKSSHTPVLLEFYAESAEATQDYSMILHQLAVEYQGKFLLARVNVQNNRQLVQQLQVRTLPTVKVIFQGKMLQDLEGPQDLTQLRILLDKITISPLDRIRENMEEMLTNGQRAEAIEMLQQIISQEPSNFALQAELCDLLILEGRIDEGRQVFERIPSDTEGIEKPSNRFYFLEVAASLPSIAELHSEVNKDNDNLALRMDLACVLVVSNELEAALGQLLEILKRDREWEEQKARTTMIRVFDLLGKGSEIATSYRRKMFTLLH
ncbi:MAG: tetratricopeptide repeat protein [Candidatus Azotimanducaceae bacterium]|uniref:Tetratricopeptide repeat protein n=1 Tax=OM182 bacterium TaxID=2510334 RepID=A0A520S2I2_9GAMM|nr:hypothetical protein [Gammaproteobacteria bacterium]OUV68257.1 MAG: hypothetical protein CBC93_02710 [Gammaproteobacteria bacterium TMED133]RZO76664.1 MAG: tetratricopeptide repeat protein [OM182 bacterium]